MFSDLEKKYDQALVDRFRKQVRGLAIEDINILSLEPGHAVISFMITDNNVNVHGFAHGGITFAACDIAAGLASSSYGLKAVTSNANINYLKPCHKGLLRTEAKVIKKGKHLLVLRAEAFNESGQLAAVGDFSSFILDTY